MRLSNKKLANPFVYQGYEIPEYFCDREAETKTLLSHLKNEEILPSSLLEGLARQDLSRTPSTISRKKRMMPYAYTLTFSPPRI